MLGRPLIDGVGLQGHYTLSIDPEDVMGDHFCCSPLSVFEVSISELDIEAGANSVQTQYEKDIQGVRYAQLFQVFKDCAEHLARVTWWGPGRSAKLGQYCVADPV